MDLWKPFLNLILSQNLGRTSCFRSELQPSILHHPVPLAAKLMRAGDPDGLKRRWGQLHPKHSTSASLRHSPPTTCTAETTQTTWSRRDRRNDLDDPRWNAVNTVGVQGLVNKRRMLFSSGFI